MTGRRDPFKELDEFLERMNEQFGELGGSLESHRGKVNVDVADHGDSIVVTADLPGYDRDDIEVRLDDETLVIDAERETIEEDEDVTYVRRERRQRSISRRVPLSAGVVAEETSASYTNGVLTVTLPKRDPELAGGKRIEIE